MSDDLEALFDLQRAADQRAVKRWQEAHPDRPGIWPDRADLVVWLMEQLDVANDALKIEDAVKEQLYDALKNPIFVHQNMLRGTIAKPSIEQIRHLYPELADETDRLLAWTYQAVGVMLSDLGQFGTERGNKLLDNLSKGRLVHDDILPWPSFEKPA